MDSIFDGLESLDPKDPTDSKIIQQREIYEKWQATTQKFAPPQNEFSDLEINPVNIYRSLGISWSDLAKVPTPTPLLEKIQNSLIEIYLRRDLKVPEQDIFAIANPDEIDDSMERVRTFGVLHFLIFGFDLKVELVLSKLEDDEEFDFFFALGLLKTPIMKVDQFLDFQLGRSFGGEIGKFSRYLTLLTRQYSSDGNSGSEPQLSSATVLSINDWVEDAKKRKNGEEQRVFSITNQTIDTDQEAQLEKSNGAAGQMTIKNLHGKLNSAKFEKAIGVLSIVKNSANEPIISPADLKLLQGIGAVVDSSAMKTKIKLNLPESQRGILYNYFHWLWRIHSETKKHGQMDFAEYIQTYFEGFSEIQTKSIANRMLPGANSFEEELENQLKTNQ